MTADPRIVSDAKIIKQISYDEIREMAHQGAKVIHPRAVEIVMRYGVPMVVKSTFLMHRVPLSRRMTRLIPWKVRMMLKAIMPVELPASRIFPSSKWTCRRIRPIMAAGSLKIWLLTVSALGV